MSSSINDERVILVIGGSGQLGREFVRQLRQYNVRVVVTTFRSSYRKYDSEGDGNRACNELSWRRLDVSNGKALVKLIDDLKPNVVINTSAYTAVDHAETDRATASAINATAPRIIAEACAAHDAVMVHFSTDYVFDGRLEHPYTERDKARPLNEYGRSKLCGERAVLASGTWNFVFRTSWLYAPGQRNFVTTMVRVLRGESPVRVVDDQHGCPTRARDVAAVIAKWLVQTPTLELKKTAGLYHLCSSGHCSWYEFAAAIRERMSPRAIAELVPIDTATFGATAARPARSVLDCTRARDILTLQLPTWRDAIDAAMPAFNDAARIGH